MIFSGKEVIESAFFVKTWAIVGVKAPELMSLRSGQFTMWLIICLPSPASMLL
jgi:hypothetical protein